eukprot:1132971-Amphidinium_carterae.1
MLSLERPFTAVDRNYRPRDFQYKNPARKIGGPEGEPLQRPGPAELSAAQLCIQKELLAGKRVPKLRVRFFSSSGTSLSSSRGTAPSTPPATSARRRPPSGDASPWASRPPWWQTSDESDNALHSPPPPSAGSPQANLSARERQLPPTKTVLQAFMQAASGELIRAQM